MRNLQPPGRFGSNGLWITCYRFYTGGVPELVDHMKTGYVAEYKNSDDLTNGVDLFLRDDVLREKAGILARQRVEDKFTLKQQVGNYLKLYSQMLDKTQ